MNILVREITSKDYLQTIDVIKKSHIESFKKIYPKKLIEDFCKKYDLERFNKKVKEIMYFIAEDVMSHRILGVIGLENNRLRTFFVHPKYQRKGIGRKLFERFMEEVKKREIKEIVLEGSPLGEPIYKHFGFKKIKIIQKERIGIRYSDAYMKKTVE